MSLTHYMVNETLLDEKSLLQVLKHMTVLWGYTVILETVDYNTGVKIKTYKL